MLLNDASICFFRYLHVFALCTVTPCKCQIFSLTNNWPNYAPFAQEYQIHDPQRAKTCLYVEKKYTIASLSSIEQY